MRSALAFFALVGVLAGQSPKDVRAAAKQGTAGIPAVADFLKNPSQPVRLEAVRQLVTIGGRQTLDPLVAAAADSDAEVQSRAVDGLVNYYVPGYARQGLAARVKLPESDDTVVDAYVVVRPDVVAALGRVARGGATMESRANACRAVGVLRGASAIPDLIEDLRSKDNQVLYEALVALKKIGDPAAGPRVVFLLRDLDDRIQTAAIETAGVLRATEGLPALRDIVASPRNPKIARPALFALAAMPEAADRELLARQAGSKDDRIRAAAVEGLGRLPGSGKDPVVNQVWKDDEKMAPRLAAAFALVAGGRDEVSPEGPLRYLINTLNSSAWKDTALAYLIEVTRQSTVLASLYGPLDEATREEKIQLSLVLAMSGDAGSVPVLERAGKDADAEVSKQALRALEALRARLAR